MRLFWRGVAAAAGACVSVISACARPAPADPLEPLSAADTVCRFQPMDASRARMVRALAKEVLRRCVGEAGARSG
jgi:hypothetical protein